jgi:asparagine synthase (glutamine-hydrolysing)
MSAIAGIIHFDSAPVQSQSVGKMTTAMASRGPDGIRHWVKDAVGFGQCMLRTTPESLEETQPLTNEDETLVLVMDGRVDNWEDLRRELLRRGSVLRDQSDAELVLRAYEAWGEDCPDRIIGEFVFFLWDARRRRLFGARDAAGARHFFYHKGDRWFAFASEIKGLLALERIEPRLNESRVFDYLVIRFDRDDEVGTFYQGVDRMPAGHAMRITAQDVKVWRYWDPGNLPTITFASLDECADAFLEQLRVAVRCRLRSIGPVGATLSGGLDSSAIVGLISKEFRNSLSQPLRTFSLIRHDRENCPDWLSIRQMAQDHLIEPTVITSDLSMDVCEAFLDAAVNADEPFMSTHGLCWFLLYEAARANGCRIVFDGVAGDLLFYGPSRTVDAIFRRRLYNWLPSTVRACRRHGIGVAGMARKCLPYLGPRTARVAFRIHRQKRAELRDCLELLSLRIARHLISRKQPYRTDKHLELSNDQLDHARDFTCGLLSFGHEDFGQIGLSRGVEPRSPFSDRRMIEFAIQMPIEAKLFAQWYKYLLRKSMEGVLPEGVRWRRNILGHPGWWFRAALMKNLRDTALYRNANLKNIDGWVDLRAFEKKKRGAYENQHALFRARLLSYWLTRCKLSNSSREGDSS